MRLFGSQSMTGVLKRVIVKKPDAGFSVEDTKKWNYGRRPEWKEAQREHDGFVATIKASGAEVIYLEDVDPELADSIYVHDPSLMTDAGAIILKMGKKLRVAESGFHKKKYQELGIPVLGEMEGDERAEGGDLLWLDPKTLVAGVGFRTNYAGVEKLRELLSPNGVDVIATELPYFTGPKACLHLMSFVSMIDNDLAVGFPRLMSVPFWQLLQKKGVEIVEVPEEEYDSMGCNVLALAPRHCLMLDCNPITKRRLEKAGCKVEVYSGKEISLISEGGATCLTRPILREY